MLPAIVASLLRISLLVHGIKLFFYLGGCPEYRNDETGNKPVKQVQ